MKHAAIQCNLHEPVTISPRFWTRTYIMAPSWVNASFFACLVAVLHCSVGQALKASKLGPVVARSMQTQQAYSALYRLFKTL